VLFVRQTYGALRGKWSLPWGYVDGIRPDGLLEPPDAAAIRETLEEAGVVAEVDGLLGIQNHCDEHGELRVYLLYRCRHVSGDPVPDQQETDKAAFFSLQELDASSEPFDEFCLWLGRRVLRGEHSLILPEPQNPYRPHLAFL
jgi:8-oxo-dGTP diphosphatase